MAVADLRRFAAELAELRRDCAALVQDLEPQSAGWRPAQGGWSVAQVIAHLRLSPASIPVRLDQVRSRGACATNCSGKGSGLGRAR